MISKRENGLPQTVNTSQILPAIEKGGNRNAMDADRTQHGKQMKSQFEVFD
jgi:hypothetical protein